MATNTFESRMTLNAQQVIQTLKQIEIATKTTSMGVDTLNESLNKHGTAATKASKQASLLGNTWKLVGKIFISQQIYRAVSAVNNQLSQSVGNARELQAALSGAASIAAPDLRNQAGIGQLGDVTKDISNQFGIDQVEVAQGLYQALSNQVGSTAQTFTFLGEAAEFARATNSTLSESVDTLSGAFNALGLSSDSNRRLMDIFFKTIDLGRVTASELANTLGRVLPLATQLGISVEEVAASLATITVQGLSNDEALTQLGNVMQKLVIPSEALNKAMNKLGIGSVQAGIATFGFKGFLDQLVSTTDGSIEAQGELFNRVRALRGLLSLNTREGDLYAETLRKIRDESEGAAEAAAKLVLSTPAAQLQQTIETLKNAFIDGFGTVAVDAINGVVSLFGGADVAAKVLLGTVGAVAVATAAIGAAGAVSGIVKLIGMMGGLTAAARLFLATMTVAQGLPILIGATVAIAGIVALAGALSSAGDTAGELSEELKKIGERAAEANKVALKAVQETTRNEQKEVRENTQVILKELATRQRKYGENAERIKGFQKAVTDDLENQLSKRSSLIEEFVDKVDSAGRDSTENIKGLNKEFRDFANQVDRGRFNRRLDLFGENPGAQFSLMQQRLGKLISAAGQTTDPEQAKSLLDEALSLAEQSVDVGREANKVSSSRYNGELLVNRVLEARQSLNNKLVAQEQAKAKAAAASAAQVRQQANELTGLLNQLGTERTDLFKNQGSLGPEDTEKRIESIKKLESEIEKRIQGFGTEALQRAGFQTDLLKQIREPFTSALTGQVIPLDFATQEAVTKVRAELSKGLQNLPLSVKLQIESLTGLDADALDLSSVQASLAELLKTLDTDIENVNNASVTSQQAYTDAVKSSKAALAALRIEQNKNASQIANFIDSPTPSGSIGEAQSSARLNQVLEGIRNQAREALASGDLDKIEQVLGRITNTRNVLQDNPENFLGDTAQTVTILNTLATQLASVAEAKDKVNNTRLQFVEVQDSQSRLEALRKNIEGIADSARQGFNGATAAADPWEAMLDRLIAKQQQVGNVGSAGQAPPTQGKSRGGLVRYFAGGGFVPRGTDTVPAMLSPGEMVINAKDTRRFYSELMAINSGRDPIYRAEGGPVTNNTYGDINVNLPSGSNTADGRAAAQAIRRELRRNTTRSF